MPDQEKNGGEKRRERRRSERLSKLRREERGRSEVACQLN
jgi:hypothetical protein